MHQKVRIQASFDKYTLHGKNAFLALLEEMLLDVDVTGPSLCYLLVPVF